MIVSLFKLFIFTVVKNFALNKNQNGRSFDEIMTVELGRLSRLYSRRRRNGTGAKKSEKSP